MASIGHVAVGIALGRAWDPAATPWQRARTMIALGALALMPDLDVVAFALDIPYSAPFGHRGATHSLAFAAAVAVLAAWAASKGGLRFGRALAFSFAAIGSHGLLDALTDGGLGAALLWPFSDVRFFFPVQPLPVAPIGRGFLSSHGIQVALKELALFAPLWLYAFWPLRRRPARAADTGGGPFSAK